MHLAERLGKLCIRMTQNWLGMAQTSCPNPACGCIWVNLRVPPAALWKNTEEYGRIRKNIQWCTPPTWSYNAPMAHIPRCQHSHFEASGCLSCLGTCWHALRHLVSLKRDYPKNVCHENEHCRFGGPPRCCHHPSCGVRLTIQINFYSSAQMLKV